MNEASVMQIVALAAWLTLMIAAYASFKLEWRTMVKQALIWASLFALITLVISLIMG